jgi:ASC-1-like (ASCH) protein
VESKKHQLKIHPEYFQAICEGEKTFEIRRNDRDYQVGDELFLNEFDPEKQKYTGRREKVIVSYITDYAQVEDYIVMAIIFD